MFWWLKPAVPSHFDIDILGCNIEPIVSPVLLWMISSSPLLRLCAVNPLGNIQNCPGFYHERGFCPYVHELDMLIMVCLHRAGHWSVRKLWNLLPSLSIHQQWRSLLLCQDHLLMVDRLIDGFTMLYKNVHVHLWSVSQPSVDGWQTGHAHGGLMG